MTSSAVRPRWCGWLALLWLLQAGVASAQAPATLSGQTINLTITGDPTPYSIEFGASTFTLRENGSFAQSGTYTYSILSGTQGRAVLNTTAPVEDAGNVDTLTLLFSTATSGTFVDEFVWNDSTTGSYSGTFTTSPPVITTQPRSKSVTEGGNVTLSVSATGNGTLTYQWFRDLVAVNGATASSLPLTGLTSAQAGRYHVAVANAGGVTHSDPVYVVALPAGGGTFAGSDDFSDNSRDTARWGTTEFGRAGTTVETNARLEFRTSTNDYATGIWGWHSGLAPYTQDWEARVTVDLPNLSFTVNDYQWVNLGIRVINSADPGDRAIYGLEIGRSGSSSASYRHFLSEIRVDDLGRVDLDRFATTISTKATLRVRWLAAEGLLHFEYDADGPVNGEIWTLLRTLNPAATWGMSSGSFGIGIGGESENLIIPSNAGLWLDDFAASTAPVITTHPQNQIASATSNVTFTVAATGSGLTYQWRKGMVEIGGATNTTLTVTNVTRAASGAYSVLVTSGGSSTQSSTATLRVIVPQQLFSQRAGGGQFQLLFADPDGGLGSDLSRFEVHHTSNFLGASTVWVTNSGGFTLSNGKILFDDVGSTGTARRFYRVVEK